MKQKISTRLGLLIIGTVSVTILVFVTLFIQRTALVFPVIIHEPPHPSASFEIPKKPLASPLKWVEVTTENFWNRSDLFAKTATLPYHFAPIKFSYPSNWKFSCCWGMDHAEGHNIIPVDSVGKYIEGSPTVSILIHGLAGCPAVIDRCSLDEQIRLTPSQKYQRMVSNLPENAKVLPKRYLPGLKKNAFAYEYSRFDPPIQYESYVFTIDDEVVEVEFKRVEKLERNFIDAFLNEIRTELEESLPTLNHSVIREVSFCDKAYKAPSIYPDAPDIIARLGELSTKQTNPYFCDNLLKNNPEDSLEFEIYRSPLSADHAGIEYYVGINAVSWRVENKTIYTIGGYDGSLTRYGIIE